MAGDLVPGEDGLTSFVITYTDGTEDHRRGTLLDVSRLASTTGLHLAHSSPGTFRWARS